MRRISTAVLGFVLCSPIVRADIIYTNFGPDYSHSMGGNWAMGDMKFASSFDTGSGYYTFDGVRLGLVASYYPSYGNTFHLDLATLEGGVFTTLESMDSSASRYGTALVSASGTVVLSPDTTYWLVLSAPENNYVNWYMSPGDFGAIALDQGEGWDFNFDAIRSALEVYGTPVDVATPEPATLGLLASAALALGFRRFRRGSSSC